MQTLGLIALNLVRWVASAIVLLAMSLLGYFCFNWILPLVAQRGEVNVPVLRLWDVYDDTLDGLKEPRFVRQFEALGFGPGDYLWRVFWLHRNCAYGWAKLLGRAAEQVQARALGGIRLYTANGVWELQVDWPWLWVSWGWKIAPQYTTTRGDLTTEANPLRALQTWLKRVKARV